MRIQRRFLLGIGAVAAISTIAGYGAARYAQNGHLWTGEHAEVHVAAAKSAASDQKYTCPMHPEIVQDHPGSCPICGMTLVKVAGGKTVRHSDLVHVDASTQQHMGVKLETVALTDMHRPINAFATILQDESRTVSVNPKVEGWIRRLHVQGAGQAVLKGQVLYEIYSPELQQRQRDYIDLLTRRDAMLSKGVSMDMTGPNSAMLGSIAKERFRVRDRLLAADVSLDVIEAIEKHRRTVDVMPVRATQSGFVTAVSAREGSYVNPMQPVLTFADNSRVWVEVTMFPDQIGWIKSGDEIVVTSGLDKAVKVTSRIDLSTLQVDAASKTAKLRLPLSNASGAFHPGTFADVSIKSRAHRALSVPRDAVIRTGHGDFVVVGEGDGHFRSAPVVTGMEDARSVEILSGLSAGASIAVNGQFLLDAASSIQAMQSRLAPLDSMPEAGVMPAMHMAPAKGSGA